MIIQKPWLVIKKTSKVIKQFFESLYSRLWRRGVVVITTAQLHATKPELRFCAGSNPACGVLEIRDDEDLWQWSRLEIRLNAFRRLTIPQKQFIIIIIRNRLKWVMKGDAFVLDCLDLLYYRYHKTSLNHSGCAFHFVEVK